MVKKTSVGAKSAKFIWEDEFEPGSHILVSSPSGDFEATVNAKNPDGTLHVLSESGVGQDVNIVDVVRKIAMDFTNPSVVKTPEKITPEELERATRLSLSAEEDAVSTYKSIADATDDELVKEVMNSVADEEAVHAGEFEELVKELDPDEQKNMDDGAAEVQDKKAFLVSAPYQGERGGKWWILDDTDTVIDEANSAEEAEQLKTQYERGEKQVNQNFVEDQYKKTKGAGADWESNLDIYTPPSKERWCHICDAPMGAMTDAEYEAQGRLCQTCREYGGAQSLNPDLGALKRADRESLEKKTIASDQPGFEGGFLNPPGASDHYVVWGVVQEQGEDVQRVVRVFDDGYVYLVAPDANVHLLGAVDQLEKLIERGEIKKIAKQAELEDLPKKTRWCSLCDNPAGEFDEIAWEKRLHLCDQCLHEGFGESKVMDLSASKKAGIIPPEISGIIERFEQSGVTDAETWEGIGPGEWKVVWTDNETGLPMLLTVSPNGWSFVVQDVHVQRQGFDYPPDFEELVSVWAEAREAWEALRGQEYPANPSLMAPYSRTSVDPGSILAGGEAAPGRYGVMAGLGDVIPGLKFAAVADDSVSPLHRFYQTRDVPGDPQRIIVADGVMKVHEVFGKFEGFIRLMGIQFERIEATRYAGTDAHIDRGRLWLKAEIVAGAPIARRAKLSIMLTIKEGEISDAAQFVDASHKHRLLNEEGLRAYLRLQENPPIMHAPNIERAQIDRTMLPPTPSKSLFHGRGGVDA